MITSANNRNRRAGRAGFTLVELMVVIAIIAIASVIGMGVYMRVAGESEQRAAENYLQTLATALKAYEAEKRDFPPMRLTYIDNPALQNNVGFAASGVVEARTYTDLPNVEQSIEAALYCMRYRSNAGASLESLPGRIVVNADDDYVAVDDYVTEGARRQLDEILDPWGNPIQYIRPRNLGDADDPLSRERLNNQVILVSMGPDGMPGQAGVDDDGDGDMDVWQDDDDPLPLPLTALPAAMQRQHPDPKELGMGDDIRVVVGSVR